MKDRNENLLPPLLVPGPEKYGKQLIAGNEKAVSDYRAGKEQSLSFLVGQVMKATKGRANPALAKKKLLDRLGGN